MFIKSNKRFVVKVKGEDAPFTIPRDFVGDIPDKVAECWLVREAIKAGDIVTPKSHKDADVEKADVTAKKSGKRK